MELVFWTLAGVVLWCYFGYPAAMLLRARLRKDEAPALEPWTEPRISVVVAVRNEANRIGERIDDLLEQRYAPDRCEIIVACNGCTDGTEEVVAGRAREEERIRMLVSPAAEGKAGALNRGVRAARGSIVIFGDARQRFSPDAVRRLVGRFRDPAVGAASGRLRIGGAERPSLEGIRTYWNLETRLRLAESATGSVVGATGAIYAIRKELFVPMPPGLILDDVHVPMWVAREGYRVVLEPEAVAMDRPASDERSEYARKVRSMVGNLQILRTLPWLLSPIHNPLFGRYLSHKVLRLATPLCLAGTVVLGFALDGALYRAVAVGQLLLYGLGAVGLLWPLPALALPAAFLLVHLALIAALLRPRRSSEAVWTKART